MSAPRSPRRKVRRRLLIASILALSLLATGALAAPFGQTQSTPPPSTQQKPAPPAGDAGGPSGDVGPIALPKRPDQKPVEPKPKKPEGMPDFSLRVDVPLVNVDVFVTTK